ncbi:class A sortase [Proteiniclasticum sp.]|uniref:class A sortase n=1 Tax=Proteiniclasticum sp. TaxID=2053595 RepID=UPI00289F84EF|nr:class A sortase [Proteiniclasticum sp.]
MKKVFAVLLIVFGLLLIFSPKIKDTVVENTVENTVEIIAEYTPEKIKENEQNEEAEFDFSIVEDISVTGTLMSSNKVNKDLLVGQLVIPRVGMNIPIFKGINNSNLLAGSATMRKDQRMGTGNYPLAGHYMKEKDVLFGSLMDVQEGDLIRVTDKETIFEYVTYEVKVVPDTAVYIIDDDEADKIGKPIISLMTCYYSSKTGKRYFVMGELKDSYPYSEELLYAK